MIIIHDIETIKNCFLVSIRKYDKNVSVEESEKLMFEISDLKNDWQELSNFYKQPNLTCVSFNGINFDDIILNYIVNNKDRTASDIYSFTQKVIESSNFFGQNLPNEIKKYKYPKWQQIDLYLYWSRMLRLSKKLSLKSIACDLRWYTIQEMPIDHSTHINFLQVEKVREYCENDTAITYQLAKKLAPEINLRYKAKNKYGFNCLSWDGVKLGLNLLIYNYAKQENREINEIKELRTIRTEVKLSDIILPEIKFNENNDTSFNIRRIDKKIIYCFKSFQGLYLYLKDLTVKDTKSINCRVSYKGNIYDVKSGGLHTVHNASIIQPSKDKIYEDIDASGYYPSLGSLWQFVPKHLPNLDKLLLAERNKRIELKRNNGDKNEIELIKLENNGGFYGNLNNEYTPMYDWKQTLSITINGQLFLLMLCEWCEENDIQIDMCNTDGISIIYNKEKTDLVTSLIKRWEQITKMEMERVQFTKVVRSNINNYLALYKDKEGNIKSKQKGLYRTETIIGNGNDFMIIAIALEKYFKDNITIEESIKTHTNIYDFLGYFKVDKKYNVYWNGIIQQNLNRFYASDKGAYLYKKKKDGTKDYENLLKGNPVIIFNNYKEKPMEEYNINYNYYINECNKIIQELTKINTQLF